MFEATHEVILRLVGEGLIDGLRVDHPDGLADPRGYLRRLAERTGGLWVSTEKILSGPERLPADWPCAGTTGYDALRMIAGLFLDPAGAAPLTAAYERLTAGPARFAGVAEAAKRQEASQALAAEVTRLARLAGGTAHPGLGGLSAADRVTVLAELLTAMPVYRAYVVPGEPAPPVSAEIVARAAGAARPRLPQRLHAALDAVADLVLGRGGDPGRPAHRRVPAGLRAGDGQGRGGHRVLPLVPAGRAQRGRRGSGHVRDQPGGVPRVRRPAGPGLAGHDDHPVHARHQAPGGRPRPAGRAGRDPGGLGGGGDRLAGAGRGPGQRGGAGRRTPRT